MPRLEVPLLRKANWASGQIALRAELRISTKDKNGLWLPPLRFRIDTGSEMSTMPAALAMSIGLPMPRRPDRHIHLRGIPCEIRSGLLRTQILGLGTTQFNFPCYFVGDPAASTNSGHHPVHSVNVLGLTGVVDKIRLLFDGTPMPHALDGLLTVEAP